MTMKMQIESKNFFSYCRAVFRCRSVLISAGFLVGGLIGWEAAGLIQLFALRLLGSSALPYTNAGITVAALATVGGMVGVLVSEIFAARHFWNGPEAEIAQRRFPYPIPAGMTWQQVIFQFHDNENAIIRIGQFRHTAGYLELGLADGRGKEYRPSSQWHFLKVLADLNGELSIKDPEADDRYKKQKQILSQKLKAYFAIDYDPFFPYRAGQSYRIKMTLIPAKECEMDDPEDMKADLLSEDIRASYAEETPSGRSSR